MVTEKGSSTCEQRMVTSGIWCEKSTALGFVLSCFYPALVGRIHVENPMRGEAK